jgi:hypothetical protein
MSDSCQPKTNQEPLKLRLRTWSFWKPIVFTGLGGLGGFLYYYYVGCASGACGITSNPYASIAFGGFFGYFLVNRPCAC